MNESAPELSRTPIVTVPVFWIFFSVSLVWAIAELTASAAVRAKRVFFHGDSYEWVGKNEANNKHDRHQPGT